MQFMVRVSGIQAHSSAVTYLPVADVPVPLAELDPEEVLLEPEGPFPTFALVLNARVVFDCNVQVTPPITWPMNKES